ncbi:MAG TPA: type II toxin-antitoxin system PemK/MazF family toxin [Gemmataceae bacterium]|jgi:mRNA interferase MazF|nr:type II toxin-antitoxin system PemK/MazF family toxin [Gemmataceae bacterium]
MKRGDVVLADFPFQDIPGSKVRPAVVVQNDTDNQALANTIVAMISGNLSDAGRPANVFVDPATSDGAGSGLRGPSLIKCCNLATVRQQRILRVIGQVSNAVLQQVNAALKAALELP